MNLAISHKPEPISKESQKQKQSAALALLGDIDPQIAADWQALRAKKRAPITATAIDRLRAEAAKAGMSLQDALALCCQRGWTGFEAAWLQKNNGPPAVNGMSPYQQMQVEKHEERKRFAAEMRGEHGHDDKAIDGTAERLD